ncbi:MAG: hypothetical protein OQL19_09975 [Gammaproteobacteria bacterium]|nr:hypothetical protein [Gammaproteobacteria bacterium]
MKWSQLINRFKKGIIYLPLLLVISFPVYSQNINQEMVLQSIIKNILIKDSHHTVVQAQKLEQFLEELNHQTDNEHLVRVQKQFVVLLQSWKKVEALYMAGNINSDMLDVPRYIDVFHSGNENIEKQLNRSLNSDKKIDVLLFKNSTKSINALEYLLFASVNKEQLLDSMKNKNKHRVKMAQYINKVLTQHFLEIEQFYKNDNQFVPNGIKSIEDLVNVLIDSSYKLLTWRVAEPAGLAEKYKGKVSKSRLEYHWSEASFLAIESILHSYKDTFNSEAFMELGDLGMSQGVSDEINSIQKNIENAIIKNQLVIKLMKDQSMPLSQVLISSEYRQLHKSLIRLHNSFYILLIEALGLTSKIIEADGD